MGGCGRQLGVRRRSRWTGPRPRAWTHRAVRSGVHGDVIPQLVAEDPFECVATSDHHHGAGRTWCLLASEPSIDDRPVEAVGEVEGSQEVEPTDWRDAGADCGDRPRPRGWVRNCRDEGVGHGRPEVVGAGDEANRPGQRVQGLGRLRDVVEIVDVVIEDVALTRRQGVRESLVSEPTPRHRTLATTGDGEDRRRRSHPRQDLFGGLRLTCRVEKRQRIRRKGPGPACEKRTRERSDLRGIDHSSWSHTPAPWQSLTDAPPRFASDERVQIHGACAWCFALRTQDGRRRMNRCGRTGKNSLWKMRAPTTRR